MHPILELMMEHRLNHSQVSVKSKNRPMGLKYNKPPKPPKKQKTNRILAVSNRDRPKTREIRRNLMKIAQRAEAYKNSLHNVNENTEINESR